MTGPRPYFYYDRWRTEGARTFSSNTFSSNARLTLGKPLQLQMAYRNGALKTKIHVTPGSARASGIGPAVAQLGALAMKAHIERLVVGIANHDGNCIRVHSVGQIDIPVAFG